MAWGCQKLNDPGTGADGLGEVVVGELGVQDSVLVILEVRRFDAAWDRLPAVWEEDGHGGIVSVGGDATGQGKN